MQDLLDSIRTLELKTRRLVDTTFAGEYHSAFKGRGLEFDEVRPYQVGDDVKSIDWNVTARTGQAFVKVFREERELVLSILFDISGSNDFGQGRQSKRQVGTEIAAVLAFSALKNNDKIGLSTFTDQVEQYFPPQKGRKHILRLIRTLLTTAPQHKHTDLTSGVNFLMKVLKQQGIVVIISDFLDKGYKTALSRLNKKQEVILVHLFHPDETLPGISGTVPIRDLEKGKLSWVHIRPKQHKPTMQDFFHRNQKELKSFCGRNRIGYLAIDTTQDFVPVLAYYFRNT